MRKSMPQQGDQSLVTTTGRQLLALALCHIHLATIEQAVQYADLSIEDCTSKLAALVASDSNAWLALKEGEEEVRSAFEADRERLGLMSTTFSSFWAQVWESSVYRAAQDLISIRADVWREHLVLSKADADKIEYALINAAYSAYCAADRFDRFPTIIINGSLLRQAVTIA